MKTSVLLPENLGSKDLTTPKASKGPEGATVGAGTGAAIGGALGSWQVLARWVRFQTFVPGKYLRFRGSEIDRWLGEGNRAA